MLKNKPVHDFGGVHRSTLGGNGHGIEDLKRTDERGHHDEHQHWPQEGQGDVPKGTYLIGTVNRGRFVYSFGYRLQTGENEEGGVAKVTPDVDTGN